MDELIKRLQNPTNQYRGKPFWAWNGRLDIDELKRQIDVMKGMGFGGFFMHSRTGLKTEYMGAHWFRCIRACAEYAYSIGLEAWLYDEDRWPSGTCGGLVTKKKRNRMRFISLNEQEPDDDRSVLARFAFRNADDFFAVKSAAEVPEGHTYQVYTEEFADGTTFYNGYTYLDTLNEDAVRDYIESTHEVYKRECGDLFGREIKGIFTDEPHRGPVFSGFSINNKNSARMCPYTGRLFDRYLADWNESLQANLPRLFFSAFPNEIAYRYIETLQRLFLDAFAKPYHRWCKENNLLLTGHILHEDSLTAQVSLSGSMMRYYPHMDYPGIDNLTLKNECYPAVKQCVSVAKQYGKPFVLSEMYAVSGWGAGLEDFKYVGDWQAFYGITLRCPHLSWYTMSGVAKRDYPMSILHQAAIQNDWHFLEDYYARLSYLYTNTRELCTVLVVSRIEKSWQTARVGWIKDALTAVDEDLIRLETEYTDEFRRLRQRQVAFDYADEGLLSDSGRVVIKDGKTYIAVGEMRYSVLYDNGGYARESTKKLIETFKEKGGRVIDDIGKLPKTASAHTDIAVSLREGLGYRFLFMMNFSRENDYAAANIRTALTGYAYEYDVRTNRIVGRQDAASITADFLRKTERVFIVTDTELSLPPQSAKGHKLELCGYYPFTLNEDNVLPIKDVTVSVDGRDMYTGNALEADRKLRAALCLQPRANEMYQPWFKEKYDKNYAVPRGAVRLTYRFTVDRFSGPLYLAYEGDYTVTVNGAAAAPTQKRWKDICFTVVEFSARPGENTVVLEKNFAECDDVEYVYVLGGFGVDANDALTTLPETLCPALTNEGGLPYYAGEVHYFTGVTGKANILHRRQYREISAKLVYDGKEDYICCYPYTVSVDAQKPVTLSVVLSAEKLFFDEYNAEEE